MTTATITTEQAAAFLLNAAVAFAQEQPSREPTPETVELRKLAPMADGSYAVIPNGSVSKVPSIIASNPTRLTNVPDGEEMAALRKAARGESDVPTHQLWAALEVYANKARPSVQDCVVMSRAVNTIAAARRGVALSMRDLT